MNQANDAQEKAEKLVDFIIASDRLEGLETSPEERELLIKIALGEVPFEEYLRTATDELRQRADTLRALSGSSYDPSGPDRQQPHPRFTFNEDKDNDETA